jgi:hypothetical protein
MFHVYPVFAFNSLRRIFGWNTFRAFGPTYEPLVYGAAVLTAYWLVLCGLHWRRIHVRI